MKKVIVVFDNFGPYHIARLAAASKRVSLLAIEIRKYSREYGWKPTDDVTFRRMTLEGDGQQNVLDQLQTIICSEDLAAIAVPGWSGPYAFNLANAGLRNSVPLIVMSESQQIDFARRRFSEFIKARYLKIFSAGLVGGKSHREYLVNLGMD